MKVIKINVIRLQPAQTSVHRFLNVNPAKPLVIPARSHGASDFCRKNYLVPNLPDSFSHYPLTLSLRAAGIDICRINKIYSSVKGVLNGFFRLVRSCLFSKSHRSKTDF